MFLTQNPQSTVYIRTPEPPWSRRSVSRWKISNFKLFFTWENSDRREFYTGMTIWYRIAFTWWCVISHLGYFEVRFKIANITHALPVPVHRQTDFTPKRVVVSRLHDAGARFRTGMKFSPRYYNRCKLTPRWLAHTRHFVGYHVNKCKAMWKGTRSKWTRAGAKVAPVSSKDPKISR